MSNLATTYNSRFFSHIPHDWSLQPLKTLVREGKKITYGIVQPGKYDPDGVMLIRGQDYMNGWVDKEKYFKVSPKLHKKFKRSTTSAGDVLLSIAGYTGSVAIVPEWIKEANLTQTTARISCDTGILDARYLSYFLQCDDGRLQSRRYTKGSAQEGLNLEDIERFFVSIPPLPEQQKIAAILSSVDDVIEKTQAQIDKLKDLKTGIMQELLSPREGQAANKNSSQGESKNSLHHTEFKDSPLGRIPVEWEYLTLRKVVEFSQGIQVDLEMQSSEPFNGSVPFIRIENYTQRSKDIRHIDTRLSRDKFINSEDIVLVRYGATAGFVGRGIEGVLANNLFQVKPNEDKLTKDFLYLVLLDAYKTFQLIMSGGAMPALNFKMVGDLELVVPPIEEQCKITNVFQSINDKETAVLEKLSSLKNIKKALMQDLLTGKVRVKVDAA